jgi:hypothetical protein
VTQQIVAFNRAIMHERKLCQLIEFRREKAGRFKQREGAPSPLADSPADKNAAIIGWNSKK